MVQSRSTNGWLIQTESSTTNPCRAVERADAFVGRFGLEKDANQTAGPSVGQQVLDQGGAGAATAHGDVDLVEDTLRAAGFDRPAPRDHGVGARLGGDPDDTVAIVREERDEGRRRPAPVERVTIDRAELFVERDEGVEIVGDRSPDRLHADQSGWRATMLRATSP